MVAEFSGALAPEYKVTFSESGLPYGAAWSVTLLGRTLSSTNDSVALLLANGTYSYSAYAASASNPEGSRGAFENGSLTVAGIPKTVALTWTYIPGPEVPGNRSAGSPSVSTSGVPFFSLAIGVTVVALAIALALAVATKRRSVPMAPPPAPSRPAPAHPAGPGRNDPASREKALTRSATCCRAGGGFEMGAARERPGLTRRLRFDTPRGRAFHLMLAVLLVLAGLSVELLNGATPATQVTTLATSGSFFAMAESGNTIYAASENGGSVLLERSTDRGVDWTANPVPYSIVAGGVAWTRAAVAVDGSNLVLTASSGGTNYGTNFYPPPTPRPFVQSCGENSTVLLASSQDGGTTWSTSIVVTPSVSVTSLQAGVVGSSAAVAWLGESTACGASAAEVEAVTSDDAGHSWSSIQPIGARGESVPTGEGVEIAPGSQGLVIAFGLISTANRTSQLGLWTFASPDPQGFSLTTVLPAPASWTLQGSSDALAYLLTPTYLIPLTSPPYTALPFNELQSDGTSIGNLPNVVSLVPLGGGQVEVAATTSDSLGVDCWLYDTTRMVVMHTCHVELGSPLLPSSQTLPIVALIDGGGWWVAIGASGDQCGYGCPSEGYAPDANFTPPPVSAPSAVGTSVCITGCSSAQGLAAYSFGQSTSTEQGLVSAIAGGLVGLGLLWLARSMIAHRRARSSGQGGPGGPSAARPEVDLDQVERRHIRREYFLGLAVWVMAWTPLALLSVFTSLGSDPTLLGWLVVLSGVAGALAAIPLHAAARSRLQKLHGIKTGELFDWHPPELSTPGFARAQSATGFAYASWAIGAILLLLLVFDLSTSPLPAVGAGAGTSPVIPAVSPGWIILGGVTVLFAALRGLYHDGLAKAAATAQSGGDVATIRSKEGGAMSLRTHVGAALLPWNPFLGLLLGFAFSGVLSVSPYLVAWAFLPVTLLGIAILLGAFGPTDWSPESSDDPRPVPPDRSEALTGPG